MSPFSSPLRDDVVGALGNRSLKTNMRRAMDGLVEKRRLAFPDPQRENLLRDLAADVKRRTLDRLPDLLVLLERNCVRNGIAVHWAESRKDAADLILDILRAHRCRIVVKGKSMVCEEIDLNARLERDGLRVVESDLGEYIIQLAGEAPSHIIAPAIHKNAAEIAALFARHFPESAPESADPEALVAFARRQLRRVFQQADAGVSGVNFAVAETGTLCLVENEGNGRLTTAAPPVHIAVAGIEKLIPELDDLPLMLDLLTRSATGQPVSNYVNLISKPRQSGEKDGPQHVHLVLLDGARSRIHRDPLMRRTLACIRCGACLNHCPVYARIGGHSYRSVYPGPIGKILTPQLYGRRGDMPHASTLCGACAEKCPVKIPIPDILRALREPGAAGQKLNRRDLILHKTLWGVWRIVHRSPPLYRLAGRVATRLGNRVPTALAGPFRIWNRHRARPPFAPQTLHELARKDGFSS